MKVAFTVVAIAAAAVPLIASILTLPRLRLQHTTRAVWRSLVAVSVVHCIATAAIPLYIALRIDENAPWPVVGTLLWFFLIQAASGVVGLVVVPLLNREKPAPDTTGVEELRREAFLDPLTGLHNRRYLDERLKTAMTERHPSQPLSLLLIDVDNFKDINDSLGHQGGDRVLQSIAMAIASTLRSTDILGRFGGDEFVAVLPDADPVRALQLAERVAERVKEVGGGILADTTVSIGLSSFPEHGDQVRELLHAADEAMYSAKRNGRRQVAVAGDKFSRAERGVFDARPDLLGGRRGRADLDHPSDASASPLSNS